MACPWTPSDCAGGVVSSITNSAVDGLVHSIATAVDSMLQMVSTFWLNVPTAKVAEPFASDPGTFGPVMDSPAIQLTRMNLEWLVVLMVAVGLIVAMARMAITNRVSELVNLGRMYLILTLVTGISTIVVTGLLTAGDAMAPWFIEQATKQDFAHASTTLITATMLAGTGQGAGLVLGLLALLASLLQIIAMLIRGAFIVMLMGVLPVLAADTTSEPGFLRFKRAIGWLTACVIYKPVAAVIYAVGFMQLKGGTPVSAGGNQMVQSLYDVITGLIIIVLAVIALPALMRFVAPVASQAGGGPGVAAAVGAVASGAEVVAGVIATGGAGAGAGAAAGGGASTATATGSGSTAATGGGATGGGPGGGASGGGPGGGASGGGPGGGGGKAAGYTAQGAGLVAQGASGVEQTAHDTASGNAGGAA